MAFDPLKFGEAVERYLGPRFGRLLMRVAIVTALLAVIGGALQIFLGEFIGGLVWPFLTRLFGAEITLDNIETIVIVLVTALVFFVLVTAIFVLVLAGVIRKRSVPQGAIDDLAEYRSQGISILNKTVAGAAFLANAEKDDYVQYVWHTAWSHWRNEVVNYLEQYFTKAEMLSFSRLGRIDPVTFSIALNGQHAHYLMQLSKQLTILENLIDRYQQRR